MDLNEEALIYHSKHPAGKLQIQPTKRLETKKDLSLAYSPGVAAPCLEIEKDEDKSYDYTNRGNSVGVISNGTAVLGLGDIGALASKPVMEGKSILFKKFSGIDSIDIEIEEKDPDKFITIVESLKYSFGGINLEDIKAPGCFKIEEELKKRLDIPVMHDDQHGTAIITAAGLINSLEIVKKSISNVRVIINGAGSGAIAVAKLIKELGLKKQNLIMLDSKGVIDTDRKDINIYKKEFAGSPKENMKTLEEVIVDADVFIGLGVANVLNSEMVKNMAKNPIIFALANPDPEIPYEEAINSREDVIVATGRSDYPNQVNNVLGFPFIFRGALDTRSTCINEEMKLAAVQALANLAKEPVPIEVKKAYSEDDMSFGRLYILPKPLDPRLLEFVSPAVAKAAMDSGVARKDILDWDKYKNDLRKLLN